MENVAVINLVKLRENALSIRGALPKGNRFLAVVKADGYGHGGEQIASAIYDIVDGYAVALVEEGIRLRYSGIDKEILVLIPPLDEPDIEKAIENDLTLSVENLNTITLIDKRAKAKGKIIRIEIIVNTGMNRFGFNLEELICVLPKIKKLKNIIVTGVFSHFYQAENPLARKKQVKSFRIAEKAVKDYFLCATAHISSSGGLLKGEFFDGVRVGIMLYGYYPYQVRNTVVKIKPIMSLDVPIIKSEKINEGERFLYGNYFQKNNFNYSLIRFGYADGLSRKGDDLTINNRCMDVSAIKINEGIVVENEKNRSNRAKKRKNDLDFYTNNEKFYNLLQNADKIAKKYDTISYEILTSITKRAKKEYIR